VIKTRRESRLAEEPPSEALVPRQLGHEELERDAAPALHVLGDVDPSHRTPADQRDDAKAADARAGCYLGLHRRPISLTSREPYLKPWWAAADRSRSVVIA
jgi:hypothetical protein